MALIWDRYVHVGTCEQYRQGAAPLAAADPAFQMFTTLAGMYLLVPLAVLLLINFLGAKNEGIL